MPEARHLQWHLFQENYLDPGVPARLPVHGSPEIFIVFQPSPGLLGMVIDVSVEEPLAPDRKNIFSDLYFSNDKEIPRIYVRDEPLFREFYAICTEVADRVQIGNEPLVSAITATVEAFDLLLRSAATLSAAEEVGLVGELLVLGALINFRGPEALHYWRGPDRDKHDFRFDAREIEVKTTTGAKPVHWIHGLEQLEASEGCELELLSVRLARTAGEGGISLKGLTCEILNKLSASARESELFNECINKVVGPARLDQADSHFVLRTSPKAFPVTGEFPRLRKDTIVAALADAASRICDVHYLLDIDNVVPESDDVTTLTILRAINNADDDRG